MSMLDHARPKFRRYFTEIFYKNQANYQIDDGDDLNFYPAHVFEISMTNFNERE